MEEELGDERMICAWAGAHGQAVAKHLEEATDGVHGHLELGGVGVACGVAEGEAEGTAVALGGLVMAAELGDALAACWRTAGAQDHGHQD